MEPRDMVGKGSRRRSAAAAALLSALVLPACQSGGRDAASPSIPAGTAAAENQIQLSHAESARLVAWAERFHTCLVDRGIQVDEPIAHATEIDMRLPSDLPAAELEPTVFACGDGLGEPPRRSSLQLRPGKLVLYLPKQCLLDPKVMTSSAAPS